jgi:hypothetical protein
MIFPQLSSLQVTTHSKVASSFAAEVLAHAATRLSGIHPARESDLRFKLTSLF